MKIEHWKQLKDFSEEEIVSLSESLHMVDSDGNWFIVDIDDMITLTSDGWEIKKSCNDQYVKSIEKPTLPFVFNK